MLKIGDLSRLTKVSVRSLRHYDKLGLLKPAFINTKTSHRYYTLDQLERLNRIIALKNLGFSLQQVGQLLEAKLSATDIRSMLEHKKQELELLVETQKRALVEVDFRLSRIEQEGQMRDCDVVVKTIEPCHVFSAVQATPRGKDIADFMFGLYRTLTAQGIELEHAIGVFHSTNKGAGWQRKNTSLPFGSSKLEGTFVSSTAYEKAIPYRNGLIHSKQLPGVKKVASIIYKGPFRHRDSAIMSLLKWVDYSHHLLLGPIREVYHRIENNNTEHTENLVEIQFPVKTLKQDSLSPL